MKVSFENPDKVNGLITLTVEEADYKDNVEKTLKNYRKKANVPGFRVGMVPMGMIKKQYGTAVKVDEINKLLGEEIYKYVKDNNIQMLGEPLPHEAQEPVDLEADAPYTFQFDIAVAPEMDATLTDKDTVDHYTITVDDDVIYDEELVEELYCSYQKFPYAVSARRVHKILFDEAGEPLPYDRWIKEYPADILVPRFDLIATGAGGILYPPGCLSEIATDEGAIRQTCLCGN